MSKYVWILTTIGVLGLVIFFILTGEKTTEEAVSKYFSGDLTTIQEADHKVGTGEVEIIEYGDFQCPACLSFFPVISEIKEERKNDVTFTFRHLPLVRSHPYAMAAHRASEAAANQDEFFKMHDKLYENQTKWSQVSDSSEALAIIRGYAEELGLDMARYDKDVDSGEIREKIDSHIATAKKLNATATPTIFVNGEKITFHNGFNADSLNKIIDNALAGKALQE